MSKNPGHKTPKAKMFKNFTLCEMYPHHKNSLKCTVIQPVTPYALSATLRHMKYLIQT